MMKILNLILNFIKKRICSIPVKIQLLNRKEEIEKKIQKLQIFFRKKRKKCNSCLKKQNNIKKEYTEYLEKTDIKKQFLSGSSFILRGNIYDENKYKRKLISCLCEKHTITYIKETTDFWLKCNDLDSTIKFIK